MPASNYQQQKLRVCDVCCAFLGIHDNDRRLADHFGGKLHVGFITLRNKLGELRVSRSSILHIWYNREMWLVLWVGGWPSIDSYLSRWSLFSETRFQKHSPEKQLGSVWPLRQATGDILKSRDSALTLTTSLNWQSRLRQVVNSRFFGWCQKVLLFLGARVKTSYKWIKGKQDQSEAGVTWSVLTAPPSNHLVPSFSN